MLFSYSLQALPDKLRTEYLRRLYLKNKLPHRRCTVLRQPPLPHRHPRTSSQILLPDSSGHLHRHRHKNPAVRMPSPDPRGEKKLKPARLRRFLPNRCRRNCFLPNRCRSSRFLPNRCRSSRFLPNCCRSSRFLPNCYLWLRFLQIHYLWFRFRSPKNFHCLYFHYQKNRYLPHFRRCRPDFPDRRSGSHCPVLLDSGCRRFHFHPVRLPALSEFLPLPERCLRRRYFLFHCYCLPRFRSVPHHLWKEWNLLLYCRNPLPVPDFRLLSLCHYLHCPL